LKRRPGLLDLIDFYRVYSSRKKVLHKVRSVEQVGKFLYLTMECDIIIRVKNSRRGRAIRWLLKMIYSKTCKRCHISKELISKVSFMAKTEHLRDRKALLTKGARKWAA